MSALTHHLIKLPKLMLGSICANFWVEYYLLQTRVYDRLRGTWLNARMEWKMDSRTERLNFIEKLYFTIVDLFCRCKSDNNMNITYINRLQQCRQSLVSKILLDIITPYAKISCFVSTSHLVWHSHPLQSIAT